MSEDNEDYVLDLENQEDDFEYFDLDDEDPEELDFNHNF